jgi:hypothetical protein
MTKDYTGSYIYEEIQGIADGWSKQKENKILQKNHFRNFEQIDTECCVGICVATGIPFFRIAQMHMIGELTRGRCSLIGAWGDATVRGGGATVQVFLFSQLNFVL